MSVIDAALEFSDAQTQVASSGTVTTSTNLIDTRNNLLKNTWGTAIDSELGGMVWNCNINIVINGTTTILAQLWSHSAESSIDSGTELARFAFPAAAPAGTRRSMKFPEGTISPERYLGVTYTVGAAHCTTGAIDSWLALDSEKTD